MRLMAPVVLAAVVAGQGAASASTTVIPVEDMESIPSVNGASDSEARATEHANLEFGLTHVEAAPGIVGGEMQVSITPRIARHVGVRFALDVGVAGATSEGFGAIGFLLGASAGVPVYVFRPFDGLYIEPSASIEVTGVSEAMRVGWCWKSDTGANVSLAFGVEHGWLGQDVAGSGELRVGYAF